MRTFIVAALALACVAPAQAGWFFHRHHRSAAPCACGTACQCGPSCACGWPQFAPAQYPGLYPATTVTPSAVPVVTGGCADGACGSCAGGKCTPVRNAVGRVLNVFRP